MWQHVPQLVPRLNLSHNKNEQRKENGSFEMQWSGGGSRKKSRLQDLTNETNFYTNFNTNTKLKSQIKSIN